MHTSVAVLHCAYSANLHSKGRDVMRKRNFQSDFRQDCLHRHVGQRADCCLWSVSWCCSLGIQKTDFSAQDWAYLTWQKHAMEFASAEEFFRGRGLVPHLQRKYHQQIEKRNIEHRKKLWNKSFQTISGPWLTLTKPSAVRKQKEDWKKKLQNTISSLPYIDKEVSGTRAKHCSKKISGLWNTLTKPSAL